MIHRENIEWCDIWIRDAIACSKPRALLIGDSITRAYYPCVQEAVKERYACARIASSKCAADPVFFKELDLVLAEYEFPVIHFNNGLHGWDYAEASYEAGLAKAFDVLLSRCKASGVIWGSTTPMWAAAENRKLDVKTDRVRERNRIASALARDRGVRINDLFSAVIDRPELFSKDGVHFLEPGQAVLGKCVAAAILHV
jgi:hypothetical protein